jgi:chemotaxis protein CheD
MSTTFIPTAATHAATSRSTRVDLGEQRLSQRGDSLSLILGSCVGLCLWDEETQTGGVAHIMLPHSQGLSDSPERFADKAVDLLLNQFQDLEIPLDRLSAKLVGGACLAESTTSGGIGQEIVAVVTAALESECVPISCDETGGSEGCRAVFDCSDGTLTIDSIEGQKRIA